MKAMVLHQFGEPLRLENVEVPEVRPRDVLVKVRACSVSMGVSKFRHGWWGGELPLIPGYEVAGEATELGEHVKEVNKGDRVIQYIFLTCGRCKYCRTGRESLCNDLRGPNIGGYAEYMRVPVDNIFKIPENITFEQATMLSDAIVTSLHAVKERAKIKPLDKVLIVGASGRVGIHTVQVAKLFGGRIIAVDISEEKLKYTEEAGADEVINAEKKPFEEEAKRLTDNNGVDAVIDLVASTKTLESSFRSLARGGTLVAVGVSPRNLFELDPTNLVLPELTVTGSRYAAKAELAESIEMVKLGIIRPTVTRTFPLEKAEEALRLVEDGKIIGGAALIL